MTPKEHSIYSLAWYHRNKEKLRPSRTKRRHDYRDWVRSLKDKPCADCGGIFPPVCMDFDHIKDVKYKGIARLALYSKQKTLEEISKCELVCANCHRVRTEKRKQNAGIIQRQDSTLPT